MKGRSKWLSESAIYPEMGLVVLSEQYVLHSFEGKPPYRRAKSDISWITFNFSKTLRTPLIMDRNLQSPILLSGHN